MRLAGSSAGSEDFTPALMEKPGERLFHGITVMPGRPALPVAVDGRPVICIPSEAQALSLGFIPVARELYDLVIPSAYLEDEKILFLLDIIRSDVFK